MKNGRKGAKYGKLGGAPKGNNNARKTTPESTPKTTPEDNPKNNPLNHNLNDKVLKEILMQLSKKDAEYINLLLLDYSDLEVYREYTVDNGRRIDIVMESKNNKVIFYY